MIENSFKPLDFQQVLQARSGDRYVTLHQLGRGGNATAYLVLAESGRYEGNLFAVKLFQKITHSERQKSFFAEIEFLKECEHPGVLRIFDQGF